jgi:hypothetical protein
VVSECSRRSVVLTRSLMGCRPEAPGDGEALGHSGGQWCELDSVVREAVGWAGA